jgi:hypothetical protein
MTKRPKLNNEQAKVLWNLQEAMLELSVAIHNDEKGSFNEILGIINNDINLFPRCLDDLQGDLSEWLDKASEEEEDKATIENGEIVYGGQSIERVGYSSCLRFEVDPWLYYGLNTMQLIELGKIEQKQNQYVNHFKDSEHFGGDVTISASHSISVSGRHWYSIRAEIDGHTSKAGRWYWLIDINSVKPLDTHEIYKELQKEQYTNEGYSEC